MEEDIRFLKELVEMDTNVVERSHYSEMASLLKQRLASIGARTQTIFAKAPDGKPRPNVIGYLDNGGDETVSINAHFDVVPVVGQIWRHQPFKLTVVGDKAFGRGTNDDKGNIVASYFAAAEARSKVNVQLLYTCDEEVGSKYGLGWIASHNRSSIKGDHAIVLDSKKSIIIGCSGVAQGVIRVRGKESHAGYPFLGRNAIVSSLPFLQRIQAFDAIAAKHVSKYYGPFGRKVNGRFNLTVINSGFKENIIPGTLETKFDMRSPPGMSIKALSDQFKGYFSKCAKSLDAEATLEFFTLHEGYETDPRSKVVKKLMKAAGEKKLYGAYGGDDGTSFAINKIPVVSYGCGNDSHHNADEYVSLRELRRVRKEMVSLLQNF